MLADELDFVIGVDTHRDTHAFAVLDVSTGTLLGGSELGADGPGYERALAVAAERAPGRRAWAIEGTGSYGAGLARFLLGRGERVVEVARPRRQGRSHAKTDALDALRAREAYQRAVDASPERADLWAWYAVFLQTLGGDPDASVHCFERELALDPDHGFALSNYALSLWSSGHDLDPDPCRTAARCHSGRFQ